jgi:hypothetical protein
LTTVTGYSGAEIMRIVSVQDVAATVPPRTTRETTGHSMQPGEATDSDVRESLRPVRGRPEWQFVPAARFRMRFAKHVNLRVGLVVPKSADLRPAVATALRAHPCKHLTTDSGHGVAFALGHICHEPHGLVWYVLALQSDIAFSACSRLRDYARGWRTALFGRVVDAAVEAGATAVALPQSDDVARAAIWWIQRESAGAPQSWASIYERTARDFGLEPTRLHRPVNIQLMPRRPSVLCGELLLRRFQN